MIRFRPVKDHFQVQEPQMSQFTTVLLQQLKASLLCNNLQDFSVWDINIGWSIAAQYIHCISHQIQLAVYRGI